VRRLVLPVGHQLVQDEGHRGGTNPFAGMDAAVDPDLLVLAGILRDSAGDKNSILV